MGDIVLVFFISHVFIFCLIFWVLTWAAEYFYEKENEYSKKNIYECGFRSNVSINVQINLNFAILCIFLILYDIEFVFLIPFYFNIMLVDLLAFFVFNLFLLFILISLLYDFQMNSFEWSV